MRTRSIFSLSLRYNVLPPIICIPNVRIFFLLFVDSSLPGTAKFANDIEQFAISLLEAFQLLIMIVQHTSLHIKPFPVLYNHANGIPHRLCSRLKVGKTSGKIGVIHSRILGITTPHSRSCDPCGQSRNAPQRQGKAQRKVAPQK